MTKIVAIDFETANNQMSSVCSVGIAVMEDGVVIDHYYSLIKPEENVSYFSPYNIRVHGITAKDVEDMLQVPMLGVIPNHNKSVTEEPKNKVLRWLYKVRG